MMRFWDLRGKARRRCLRLLRSIDRFEQGPKEACAFFRGADAFRDIERLHRAGLVTAAASKGNVFGMFGRRKGKYPFKELAVFLDEGTARERYPWTVLPRGR